MLKSALFIKNKGVQGGARTGSGGACICRQDQMKNMFALFAF